jgi:hypothetical protein
LKKGRSKSDPSGPIEDSGDWRAGLLSRLRALIMEAAPEMTEERRWVKPSNPAGVPTFSHHGLVCTGETYKNALKMTFARGAALPEPSGLFNSGLEGNTRRAIDFREGDEVDEATLKALIRAAVALNTRKRTAEGGRSNHTSPAPLATTLRSSNSPSSACKAALVRAMILLARSTRAAASASRSLTSRRQPTATDPLEQSSFVPSLCPRCRQIPPPLSSSRPLSTNFSGASLVTVTGSFCRGLMMILRVGPTETGRVTLVNLGEPRGNPGSPTQALS